MDSARRHLEIIIEYLEKEHSQGWLIGPLTQSTIIPELQVNRVGVIPKGHNTKKWHLITDLSFPPGKSVNDGVDPDLCSLTYTT